MGFDISTLNYRILYDNGDSETQQLRELLTSIDQWIIKTGQENFGTSLETRQNRRAKPDSGGV